MWNLILQWLEKLACKHQWESFHLTKTYENSDSKRPCKVVQTLVCKKCGKIIQIEL